MSRNKRESRIACLGFSYRFGNTKPAPQRRRPESNPEGNGNGFE
ncbi:hypothetical protein [Hymenobacter elongatus]|nr:hypothetical protein [Hymenobacter elongatus]